MLSLEYPSETSGSRREHHSVLSGSGVARADDRLAGPGADGGRTADAAAARDRVLPVAHGDPALLRPGPPRNRRTRRRLHRLVGSAVHRATAGIRGGLLGGLLPVVHARPGLPAAADGRVPAVHA